MGSYKKYFFSLMYVLIIISFCSINGFAHRGRTDSNGGHHDYGNASGLGNYHYHCGGYPAHLHEGGYCHYTDVFPSSVTLEADKTTLGIGEKVNISGSVYPSNSCNTYLDWSCSDSSVIELNNGVIEAVCYGTATITVESFNGKMDSLKFTVKEITADKVKISGGSSKTMYIGDSFKLSAVTIPEKVDNPRIVWNSSDSSIASVTKTGRVSLKKSGSVTITATASNGVKGISYITVKEKMVESVFIEPEELDILLGESRQITACVQPTDATHPEIKWSSKDSNVAVVSDNGTITAIGCGQTIITATSTNGIKDRVLVTVTEIVAESVSIKGNQNITIGTNETLHTAFVPVNTTIQDVIWSVDDTNIVDISEDGVVTSTMLH